MNPLAHHAFLLTAVVVCAVAAAIDVRTGNIPNWLTLGVFFTASIAHGVLAFVHHHSWAATGTSFGLSLAAGIGAALVPLALARSGGLGLGDVKLFAAIGAACGVFIALYAQTYAYVFAMIYAVILMARRRRLAATLMNVRALVSGRAPSQAASTERHAGFTELKFAPAILAGMCVAAWAKWGS